MRRLVVNANEGIIISAGIIDALWVADLSERVSTIAALAALFSGALAAAGGAFYEFSLDRESIRARLDEQRRLLELSPEQELADLAASFEERGLSPALARQVAEELSTRDALEAHAEEELGISQEDLALKPAVAAGRSALSFALGALLPVIAVYLTPDAWNQVVLIASVVGALTLTSVIAARSSQMNTWRTIGRTLIYAVAALGIATLVGLLG